MILEAPPRKLLAILKNDFSRIIEINIFLEISRSVDFGRPRGLEGSLFWCAAALGARRFIDFSKRPEVS